jgi:hypothetical protein
MNQWEEFNGNLPNVIVTEIEIQEDDNTLFAGTYGRGVWKLALPDTFKIYSNAIKVNITEACINTNVMFTLQSSIADFDSISWDFGSDAYLENATNTDTMYVNYSSTGYKDVGITTYKEGKAQHDTYHEFIKVVDNIEFEVFPNQLFSCSGESEEIFITGNYSYSFDPPGLVTQTSGNTALVEVQDESITVYASHGTCTSSFELETGSSSDDICNAMLISFGENGPFSNACGTPQTNEPVPPEGSDASGGCYSQEGWCQGETNIDNSVWFKFFVPESTNEISIETYGFDNQIAVYKANSCQDLLNDNYTLLAANDDFEGKTDYSATISSLSGFETGDTLWLQVDGSFGGAIGTFSIQLNDYSIVNMEDIPYTQDNSNIFIYPNPTEGNFIVQMDNPEDDEVNIEVIDVSGKLLLNKHYRNVSAPFSAELNLTENRKGMYMIRITTNKKVVIRKILVQ